MTSTVTAWLVGAPPPFTPVVFDYYTGGPSGAGPGTITVPSGATQVVVQLWGPGGGGGGGETSVGRGGGGAGAGGYAIVTRALVSDAGKTISYALGTAGTGGFDNTPVGDNGIPGTNATSTGSTLTNTFSITARVGTEGLGATTSAGGTGGAGGTTTGGDGGSSTGGNGTAGSIGTGGIGGTAATGTISNVDAGYGGDGGDGTGLSGINGLTGRIYVRFT
jgi:hypothetical protein